jgi:hypothetical protein
LKNRQYMHLHTLHGRVQNVWKRRWRTGVVMVIVDNQNSDTTKNRLDAAARSLLTSTALLTGLLAAFGLTSDRVPHLLDDATNAGWLLFIAGLLIVATLGLGITASAVTKPQHNVAATVLLSFGAGFLVVGLGFALTSAAIGFRGNGRPTITNIKIVGSRPQLSMSFTIRADGVDRDERMQVVVGARTLDARGNEVGTTPPASFTSILRPDDKGVIRQIVEFQLSAAPAVNSLAVRAYREKDRIQIEGKGNLPIDAVDRDCASKNFATAPGCIDVSLPAVTASPSPVPTH